MQSSIKHSVLHLPQVGSGLNLPDGGVRTKTMYKQHILLLQWQSTVEFLPFYFFTLSHCCSFFRECKNLPLLTLKIWTIHRPCEVKSPPIILQWHVPCSSITLEEFWGQEDASGAFCVIAAHSVPLGGTKIFGVCVSVPRQRCLICTLFGQMACVKWQACTRPAPRASPRITVH